MIMSSCRPLFSINGINLLCTRRLATTQDTNISKLKRDIEKSILPPKPKKPLNAFLQYFVSVKDNVHKEYPNYTYKELLKKIAEQWSHVDSTVKQNLQKQYMQEFSVYKQKLVDYENSITDDQQMLIRKELTKKEHALEKNQAKQKLAELGKPKRPLTAFFLYMQEIRKIKDPQSKISNLDWTKNVSKEWENLSKEAKNKYKAEAAQLAEKYKTELQKWEENMIRKDSSKVKTGNKENIKTGWGTDTQYILGNTSDVNSDKLCKSTKSLVLYNDKNNFRDVMKYSRNTADALISNVNGTIHHDSRTQMQKYFASAWQRFITILKEWSKNCYMKLTLTQVD